MNVDHLTIGEVTQLLAMLNSVSAASHPAVGSYCIIRCRDAGVHAGIVGEVTADRVTLRNSRRLWQFQTRKGHTLTGLALHGLNAEKSRIAGVLPTLHLERRDVCEIIPAETARDSIEAAPEHDETQ